MFRTHRHTHPHIHTTNVCKGLDTAMRTYKSRSTLKASCRAFYPLQALCSSVSAGTDRQTDSAIEVIQD